MTRNDSEKGFDPEDWLGKDFYGQLGVTPDAGVDEIGRAARELLRVLQPDRDPKNAVQNERRFRAVSEAWEVLGNDDSRKCYDDTVRVARDRATQAAQFPSETNIDMNTGKEVTRDGSA